MRRELLRRIEKKLRRFRFPGFSKAVDTIPNMLLEKPIFKKTDQAAAHPQDEPLPGTLTFVLVLGVTFAVLWFGMFMLLKARW